MKVIKMILLLCNLESHLAFFLNTMTLNRLIYHHALNWAGVPPDHNRTPSPWQSQTVSAGSVEDECWRTSEERTETSHAYGLLQNQRTFSLSIGSFYYNITKNVPRPICFRFCISLMHIMHITHMCVLLSF